MGDRGCHPTDDALGLAMPLMTSDHLMELKTGNEINSKRSFALVEAMVTEPPTVANEEKIYVTEKFGCPTIVKFELIVCKFGR